MYCICSWFFFRREVTSDWWQGACGHFVNLKIRQPAVLDALMRICMCAYVYRVSLHVCLWVCASLFCFTKNCDVCARQQKRNIKLWRDKNWVPTPCLFHLPSVSSQPLRTLILFGLSICRGIHPLTSNNNWFYSIVVLWLHLVFKSYLFVSLLNV